MGGKGLYADWMSRFAKAIRPHVTAELELAAAARRHGEVLLEFAHLERAHVLGQASTREHVRAHWAMFVWGLRNRQLGEVAGQALRIVGAVTKTWIGFVPSGNTGGSNIHPFKRVPLPAELQGIIDAAGSDC